METLEEKTKRLSSFQRFILGILVVSLSFGVCYTIYRNISKKEIEKEKITEKIDKHAVVEKIDLYAIARSYMVEHQIEGRGIKDEKVLESMRTVPREKFVLEKYLGYAYDDSPLPIGYGQTISQPYIVALMTELLKPGEEDIALEIGTGSGYQAAILSHIVKDVYTVEIVPELGEAVKERLRNYKNIKTKIGDGYFGWEEYAPFDCIVVTAAAEHIPPPLVNQLKNGGRMVIPVGNPYLIQKLTLVEKSEEGRIQMKGLMPVRFVPFVRGGK